MFQLKAWDQWGRMIKDEHLDCPAGKVEAWALHLAPVCPCRVAVFSGTRKILGFRLDLSRHNPTI